MALFVTAKCVPCTPCVRSKVRVSDIKKAIRHAQTLPKNSPEQKCAWDVVEELSSAMSNQTLQEIQEAELCVVDPLACREYDV